MLDLIYFDMPSEPQMQALRSIPAAVLFLEMRVA